MFIKKSPNKTRRINCLRGDLKRPPRGKTVVWRVGRWIMLSKCSSVTHSKLVDFLVVLIKNLYGIWRWTVWTVCHPTGELRHWSAHFIRTYFYLMFYKELQAAKLGSVSNVKVFPKKKSFWHKSQFFLGQKSSSRRREYSTKEEWW